MWGVGLSNIPTGTLGYKGPQAHMRTLVVAMQPGKLRLPGTRAALRIHFFGFVLAPSVGPGLVSKGPGNPGIVHLLAQLELFGNCATFQKKTESGGPPDLVPPGDPSIGRKVEERFTDQPTQPFFSRNKLAICVAVLLFSPICVCIHTDILPLARDIPAANQTLDSHTSTRVQRRVPLRSVKFGASCIVQDAGTMSAVVLILALEHVAIAIVECAVALHPIALELAYIPAASALIPTLFFLMITVACSIVPSTQQTTKTMPSILA